jgi:hypothetical protein
MISKYCHPTIGIQPLPSTVTLTDRIIMETVPDPTDNQEIAHLSPKVVHQVESPKTKKQYQLLATIVATAPPPLDLRTTYLECERVCVQMSSSTLYL